MNNGYVIKMKILNVAILKYYNYIEKRRGGIGG